MGRINTNIPALTAQSHLARSQRDLNQTLQRLSSGLRINRGADDPAGLIASEKLRSEMASISQAISNSERASNIVATTEGALAEVSNLLVTIKQLTLEAANSGALSQEEIEANQLQVDSAIASITRIANSTTFAGMHLLNGNLEYQTSGVNTTDVTALEVQSMILGDQDYYSVDVEGVTEAEQGYLVASAAGAVGSDVTLEISSNRGVEVFNFVSGTTVADMISAVNAVTQATGVHASDDGLGAICFQSVDYGSDAYVSVRALPSGGAFAVEDAGGTTVTRDEGADIEVTVNGAAAVGRGTEVTVNTTTLDLIMNLRSDFTTGDTTSFQIDGGGAQFQVGPHINSSEQTSIGIKSIIASRLGDTASGFLNEVSTGGQYSLLSGETTQASEIVEKAIEQISVLRGRLGAFERNTIDTNINSLRMTLENVTAAESAIRDADFAVETANLTRSQILVNAGTSVLAMANQTPQSVLGLLQG